MALIRINELTDRLLAYQPEADTAVVQKAYVWSAKLHAGSLRRSGMPYLSHPLEVAEILTQLKQTANAIAAGLLHDVLEDSTATMEDLVREFGEEIGRLVDGVTKIGKITPDASRIEVQAENYRKMILAMAQDIRVILIKLADRLHNMRTLEFLPEERQRSIAQETMEIYAPIAARLGIHWIQAQLEDLSFRHLKPDIYYRLAAQVARTREARQDYIDLVARELEKRLKEAGKDATVSGRFKHLYSIYQKMERQKLAFEEVHDLIAFRIMIPTIPDCYDALRVIHSFWTPVPGRIKDYIALPKHNMYRSLHTTVIGPEGERVEIQIRTTEMHMIAEYGIAAHWRYKQAGPGAAGEEKTLEFLHHLVEFHEELKDPYHFLESVKAEVVPEEIIVFTPGGDMIELPTGATPIDFAFAIHSDIGSHAAGAKVNGRIVPLNHGLMSGDTVEIITSKIAEPSRAWLDFVRSNRARAKITHWITTREAEQMREMGRQVLESELLRHGKALGTLIEDGTMAAVAKRFNFASFKQLFEAVGFGNFPVRRVMTQLVPPENLRTPTTKRAKKAAKKTAKKLKKATSRKKAEAAAATAAEEPKPLVLIHSFNDPSLLFAPCCRPLVGDEVVAVRGGEDLVEVHRVDCPRGLEAHPERIISARWADEVEGENEVTIEVVVKDMKGILAKLSTAISKANLNIIGAQVRTTGEKKAIHSFSINIKSLAELQRLIKNIEKIAPVISVRRM